MVAPWREHPRPRGTIIFVAFSKPIRRDLCTAWGGAPATADGLRMFAGRLGGAPPGMIAQAVGWRHYNDAYLVC